MCLPLYNQSRQSTPPAEDDTQHTVPHGLIHITHAGIQGGLAPLPSPDSVKQAPWKYGTNYSHTFVSWISNDC